MVKRVSHVVVEKRPHRLLMILWQLIQLARVLVRKNIVERLHMRQLSIFTVCMCHMLEASYICGPHRAALAVLTIVQIKDE